MGEKENSAIVEKILDLTANGDLDGVFELYHDDVVIDWPQSGERIVGKKNAYQIYSNYPEGTPIPTLRGIRTGGGLVIAENTAEYPDGSVWYWTNIFELTDGKVTREVDYFGQAFEAPEWRAQWVQKM